MPEAEAVPVTLPSAGWHATSASDALAAFGSGVRGLSGAEADRRLHEAGPNRLTPSAPASALAIFAAQFRGVVMLLLLSAGVLSYLMRDRVDAAAIGAVIAINAILGFTLELRARRAMEALMQLGATRATVVRDGALMVIDAERLVPGDLLDLAAGQTVPADARVVDETDLRTNEAALTGESLPVSKQAVSMLEADTSLADRTNMVYRGTTVSSGIARAVVTTTGNATEVGRIGVLTRSVHEQATPLERRLDALGRRLVWVAVAVALLVALLGILHGAPWPLMLETAIALAVAAVPEGLPAVATIALAVGLRRMARRHALVRRLSAVEALGSTTVICTDKTRTLTTGDMSVTRCWTAGGSIHCHSPTPAPPDHRASLIALLEAAAAASRAVSASGADGRPSPVDDPVDFAIRSAAQRSGHPDRRSHRPGTGAANSVLERAQVRRGLPSVGAGRVHGVREGGAAHRPGDVRQHGSGWADGPAGGGRERTAAGRERTARGRGAARARRGGRQDTRRIRGCVAGSRLRRIRRLVGPTGAGCPGRDRQAEARRAQDRHAHGRSAAHG